MFGLFGKKELENSTFNNVLIASLGESLRQKNRSPTEQELLKQVTDLIGNKKLTPGQINSIQLCAFLCQTSAWDELSPLLRGLHIEIPQGGRSYYDKIIKALASRAIIITDEGMAFLNQHGLK